MTDTKIYNEWRKLCEECATVRDAHLNAFNSVNQKFIAVGQGISCANPTNTELLECEKTWLAWTDVKNKMYAFIEKNA